jgi:hypothetical protein
MKDGDGLDKFDIESLRIPEEELVRPDTHKKKTLGSRGPLKEKEFCKFPFRVMASIAKIGRQAGGVVGVMAALYEIWYRGCQYNPVRLTSATLRKYGVSPHQKLRALRFLEKSGCIWVDREHGKNPLVTLKWLPLKSEFER